MRPAIVAHRGLRSTFPENTIPAVEAALALDLNGVEFDAQLTADDQVAIVHQETLEPDEAIQQLQLAHRAEGRSWIEQLKVASIQQIDAGSWLNSKFHSVKIPLLPELLSIDWGQKRAYLELKDSQFFRAQDPDNFVTRFVDALSPSVAQFIDQGGLLSFVSFRMELLQGVAHRFPQQERVLDIWFDKRGQHDEVFAMLKRCRAGTLCLPDILLLEDPSWLERCHDSGHRCFTYPVSPAKGEDEDSWSASACSSTWEQLCTLEVDGIITDFAAELCAWLKR